MRTKKKKSLMKVPRIDIDCIRTALVTCCVLLLILDCVGTFPVILFSENQGELFSNNSFREDWNRVNYWDDSVYSSFHYILSRHKRSNDTSPPPQGPTYKNAIEEFYADPNNRAMYLVLPLIILVYGGCSSIYCIHKCRQYIKRKKAQGDLNKARKRANSDVLSEAGDFTRPSTIMERPESTADSVLHINSDTDGKQTLVENQDLDGHTSREGEEEALPLQDIESYSDNENKNESVLHDIEEETSFSEAPEVPQNKMYPRIPSQNEGSCPPSRENETQPSSRTSSKQQPKEETKVEKETKPARQVESTDTNISPAVVTKKESHMSNMKKFSDLSARDIEDILNYYSNKKHMPDVIPADTENLVPLKKKARKWRYKVFNT